jgi:hypothetical protein
MKMRHENRPLNNLLELFWKLVIRSSAGVDKASKELDSRIGENVNFSDLMNSRNFFFARQGDFQFRHFGVDFADFVLQLTHHLNMGSQTCLI